MATTKTSLFALIDCDNFFVSCERVFQPAFWKKPVVVLSNNDGCIISRSNEAKALGIKMGVPYHEVRSLIEKEKVKVFSANFILYGDLSRRINEVLKTFSEEVEQYSIDESFINLSHVTDPEEYGRKIKERIYQWIGIPVSVGISTTKTLAKIAADKVKKMPGKTGVFYLYGEENIKTLLKNSVVENVWGIGYNSSSFLREHNIKTAYDLSIANEAWVKKHLKVVGLRTQMELNGKSCLELEHVPTTRKHIASSRSFGKPVTTLSEMEEAVATFISIAAMKLRKQKLLTQAVSVHIASNRKRKPYTSRSSYRTMISATDYTPELISQALSALHDIYEPDIRYARAAITLSSLTPRTQFQTTVFQEEKRESKTLLTKTIDKLNTRHHDTVLFYVKEGIQKEWKGRMAMRSPCYTTRWEDLKAVE